MVARTISRSTTLALALFLCSFAQLSARAFASTADAKRSQSACTKAVDTLTSYLAGLDQDNPVIRRPKVLATFVKCKTADAWRLRGERFDIGPKLGVLLGSPTLDTDRALDVLCQHFDAYNRTSTCDKRNGPDTQDSTTG